MKEKKKFMEKLQQWILPVGNFLSSQKHFASISAGLQATVGISIIAAFMQIISSVVQMFGEGGAIADAIGTSFNWTDNVVNLLAIPYDMTMGLLGVVAAFAIAYNLAKHYKMKQMSTGIVSMLMFVMVVAPVQTIMMPDGVTTFRGLDFTWLGSAGLFTAIIISLVSVEISHFCIKRNWIIRMPDVVPQFLQDSFTSMIPLLLNTVVIYGIHVGISYLDSTLTIPSAINNILMTPVSSFLGTVPGMIVVVVFALILWTVGVHGSMIVYPLLIPILVEATVTNATLVAQGQSPVFHPCMLFGALAIAGGTGNSFGLSLLCKFKAKSEQLKAIGNVSWIPRIFGVNEPVIFGVPIAFNPIMAIPFILTGPVIALLMYLAYSFGLMTPGYILIMALMPIGISGFLGSMDIKNMLFAWVMIPVTMLLYYPFFKVYDAQLLKNEQKKQTEQQI
ncbi:MAG: PTS sugar transporter subunit IIC [Coprobacillaceae bacterium]